MFYYYLKSIPPQNTVVVGRPHYLRIRHHVFGNCTWLVSCQGKHMGKMPFSLSY